MVLLVLVHLFLHSAVHCAASRLGVNIAEGFAIFLAALLGYLFGLALVQVEELYHRVAPLASHDVGEGLLKGGDL